MRKNFIGFSLILLTVVVAGCTAGADDEGPTENISSDQPKGLDINESVREITIEGGNYYFDSDTINVSVNETVKIVLENVGGFHDLRIPSKGIGTDRIRGGETASFFVRFEEEGSYEFICSVGNHAERGMTGTIQVG
ncbi:MAG: plastocyanin/azurin family copper-binding protein [Candidatus Nanosalina sp.]